VEITAVRKNILEKFHKEKQDQGEVGWLNTERIDYAYSKTRQILYDTVTEVSIAQSL